MSWRVASAAAPVTPTRPHATISQAVLGPTRSACPTRAIDAVMCRRGRRAGSGIASPGRDARRRSPH